MPMPSLCICACGRSWSLSEDLATFRGELTLACPGCGGGAVRLLLAEQSENETLPPADPDATVPPAFSTEDEVEPEEVIEDEGGPALASGYDILTELGRGGMGVV